ncbi:MAG: hypothetical protein Q9187_003461 [Circinaria calcarea]
MLPTHFVAVSTLATLVVAAPYPPDATISVPEPTGTPFFGNRHGNFQLSNITPGKGPQPQATGGQVTNGNVAVTSIYNSDGIGPGSDVYSSESNLVLELKH